MTMDITGFKPAVFLDRDGVLTREQSYVCREEDMHIFPYAADCVTAIRKKGYITIVVTNQSGVARGMLLEEVLRKMNERLIVETGVDAVYYCPHHPQGSIEKYRMRCDCRKPNTGMIAKAMKDFPIRMEGSYVVGDRASDIQMGKKAGMKTVLLESGYGMARLEADVTPDYIRQDLREVLQLLEDVI